MALETMESDTETALVMVHKLDTVLDTKGDSVLDTEEDLVLDTEDDSVMDTKADLVLDMVDDLVWDMVMAEDITFIKDHFTQRRDTIRRNM